METSPAGVIDLTECTFKVDDALSSKHPHCFVIDNAAEKRQTNIAASSDTVRDGDGDGDKSSRLGTPGVDHGSEGCSGYESC